VRWLSILVVAFALVAAGCGGGDDESAATDETTVEETLTEDTSTDETTTGDTTSDDTTDLSGVLADEDCAALIAAGASIAQAFSGTAGSDNTAELDALADKVPDEIEADVQVLAEAYSKYAAELQDIGIEPGATPTADQLQQMQAAIASIDQAEVTAASERLSTWADQNCSAAGG
jgi:hypothetical protein